MTMLSVWLIQNEIYELIAAILTGIPLLLGFMFSLVANECAEKANRKVFSDTRNTLSFLGEVIKSRPGIHANKWDPIAARLNRVFHNNNSNITPYFFYDGAQCLSCFIQWYVKGPKRSGSLQSKIDGAVKIYTESREEYLEEYWRRYMAQTSDSEQNNVKNDSDKGQKGL